MQLNTECALGTIQATGGWNPMNFRMHGVYGKLLLQDEMGDYFS